MVQTLFRGGCSHETVCMVCRRPSASSARMTDFYELDLGIKGFRTLAESLVRRGRILLISLSGAGQGKIGSEGKSWSEEHISGGRHLCRSLAQSAGLGGWL